MKRITLLTGLLTFVFIISSAFSQVQRHDYQKIDYIKVDQNEVQRFITLSKEILKPAFEKLYSSNEIKSWRLYKIAYPGGERSDYNFASVITVTSPDVIEKLFSNQSLPLYIPEKNIKKDKKLLSSSTTHIASELWKVENTIKLDTVSNQPSRYMVMDYMDVNPGRGLDYLMLEDEIAKPLHEERVSREEMAGWEVYSLITPGGTEYGYNFSTGNHFDSLAHIEFGFTEEIINQAMADANIPELFNTIYSTRTLVKSELWELVDYAR